MKQMFSPKRLLAVAIPLLAALFVFTPGVAQAHGSLIEYTIDSDGVTLQAMYDGGMPMAEAQIIIFAPNDPAKPWRLDQTDTEGFFSFTPDVELEGEWAVQARQAGHGAMIHFVVGEGGDFPIPGAATEPKEETKDTPAEAEKDKEADKVKEAEKDRLAEKEKEAEKDSKTEKESEKKPAETDKDETCSVTETEKECECDCSAEVAACEAAKPKTTSSSSSSSSAAPAVVSTGYTTMQKALMSACVIWGAIGTGLYATRKKGDN